MYKATPRTKPSDTTSDRVFRGGGSWNSTTATFVRAAYRYGLTPSNRGNLIGFRCAQRGCRKGVTPP